MLDAKGKFSIHEVHCPTEDEDNECVGVFKICAYLHVTGSYSYMGPIAGQPGVHQLTQNVDDMIAHQWLEVKFRVDYGTTTFQDSEVKECGVDTPSPSPSSVVQYQDGPILKKVEVLTLPSTTKYRSGDCLKGVALFKWNIGSATIAGSGGLHISPIPGLGTTSIHTGGGGSVSAGGTLPALVDLPIEWTVCHTDGCSFEGKPTSHKVSNACQ